MSEALQSTSGEQISMAVVEAVADAEDVHPVNLTPPLSQVVDPDALDALFRNRGYNGRVEFDYAGHRVRVDEGGHVTVDEPAADS